MKMKLLMFVFLATFSACMNDGNKNTESTKFATGVSKSTAATPSKDEQILASKLDNKRYQLHLLHLMAMENNPSLAHEVRIEYISEANTVILYFPQNEPAPVGKVTFFNILKTNKNRIFELKTEPSKQMFILVDDLEKGVWKIKVEWQGEDKIYSQEEKITLEPNDWARPIHE
jgi:hypothetical protein